jgi:hypothetical protein
MLILIELIQVKKKRDKETLACMSDTLPALLVWFHDNLACHSNSINDFCFVSKCHYRYYDGPYKCWELIQFFLFFYWFNFFSFLLQLLGERIEM